MCLGELHYGEKLVGAPLPAPHSCILSNDHVRFLWGVCFLGFFKKGLLKTYFDFSMGHCQAVFQQRGWLTEVSMKEGFFQERAEQEDDLTFQNRILLSPPPSSFLNADWKGNGDSVDWTKAKWSRAVCRAAWCAVAFECLGPEGRPVLSFLSGQVKWRWGLGSITSNSKCFRRPLPGSQLGQS